MDAVISVIIPARDAEPTLARTLAAVLGQTLAAPYEVIVVDDGSRDGTAAVATAAGPSVTVLRNTASEGPGAARNRGAGVARAPVLAFTDADCFPAPEWLEHGLAALERADIVQGAVVPDPRAPRAPFDRTLEVTGDGGFYQTANLFVRREVFDAVGGFRDWVLERRGRDGWAADRRRRRATRTPIGEDTLFAWRARRGGARSAFAADAVVWHEVVPGGVRDELADRRHWARDMPGLVALVPELRAGALHHRWFFNPRSLRFDLALGALALVAVTGRVRWLAGALPYGRWLLGEARLWGRRGGARVLLGAPACDAATLAALLAGSVDYRTPVL